MERFRHEITSQVEGLVGVADDRDLAVVLGRLEQVQRVAEAASVGVVREVDQRYSANQLAALATRRAGQGVTPAQL